MMKTAGVGRLAGLVITGAVAAVGCSLSTPRVPADPLLSENPAVAEWRELTERGRRASDRSIAAKPSANSPAVTTQQSIRSNDEFDRSVRPAAYQPPVWDAANGADESEAPGPTQVRGGSDPELTLPLPPPLTANAVAAPSASPLSPTATGRNVVTLDLASALEMASGQNPEVGFARQRVNEAYARVRRAEVMWLPNIRAGGNWNHHDGRIQDVAGNMIETSRSSIYGGLGAQAVGAGSPAVPGISVNLAVRDAVFQPRIAEQTMAARRFESRAVSNDVLMNTAIAYVDFLEAMQTESIANETVANAESLAELTRSFADVGQGLRSDADRADAELAARRIEAKRATETSRVAAARLARLLSVDPTSPLFPAEPTVVPLDLTPPGTSPQELVSVGLTNRPELAQNRYLVGEAVEILRREQYAPLLPSVLLGASYGGNAGGLGSDLDNFGDRVDLDAAAFWEIRNFGTGERWAQNEANARVEQTKWRQVQLMDQVASEIVEAHAQVTARAEQIDLAQAGIEAAKSSYELNVQRIQDSQGLPIEALQAIQALDAAQRQYLRAVADYNRAQFRLHRAIGWPIEAI